MSIKAGYQVVTTAAAVHGAGIPVVVYGVNTLTASSNTSLYNGKTGAGTDVEVVIAAGTIAGETVNFAGGITFPKGCFADNTDATCTVIYKVV